jgi:glycosyltransferase involved in cell wall biosynthesis
VVTVSELLADDLSEQHGRRVNVVRNGYDPADFEGLEPTGAPGAELVVSFCGEIYSGKRDPRPLFKALAALNMDGLRIKALFFGSNVDLLTAMAQEAGVADAVEFHGRVSHRESLRIQVASDILLLLMWNDPADRGTFSGKIFEYIAARRPILMLGYEWGAAGMLIRERDLGCVANDPTEIAQALRRWAKIKREAGSVPALPACGLVGMTRQEQSEALRSLLLKVVQTHGVVGASDSDRA